jgi:ferric-dicitrate binding protein FerR (iron transport regulator)
MNELEQDAARRAWNHIREAERKERQKMLTRHDAPEQGPEPPTPPAPPRRGAADGCVYAAIASLGVWVMLIVWLWKVIR